MCVSVCMSVCLSVCLYVRLSVCLYVCVGATIHHDLTLLQHTLRLCAAATTSTWRHCHQKSGGMMASACGMRLMSMSTVAAAAAPAALAPAAAPAVAAAHAPAAVVTLCSGTHGAPLALPCCCVLRCAVARGSRHQRCSRHGNM